MDDERRVEKLLEDKAVGGRIKEDLEYGLGLKE
jgi:hypothetical protein